MINLWSEIELVPIHQAAKNHMLNVWARCLVKRAP